MGREIRKVKIGWNHPEKREGFPERKHYIPLLDGYAESKEEFLKMLKDEGYERAVEYFGGAPNIENYMPELAVGEPFRIMMYETTTEGTPISPAFDTPEELAKWLADNGASAFGRQTATYEQWLQTCKDGWAPSAIVINGNLKSGVEFSVEKETP